MKLNTIKENVIVLQIKEFVRDAACGNDVSGTILTIHISTRSYSFHLKSAQSSMSSWTTSITLWQQVVDRWICTNSTRLSPSTLSVVPPWGSHLPFRKTSKARKFFNNWKSCFPSLSTFCPLSSVSCRSDGGN